MDRKTKPHGFYEYSNETAPNIWPELTDQFPTKTTTFNREEIIERLLFAQVIEAVWCLQEGVIRTIAEANLGSIHGWGFPAFRGGVVQYINDYGLMNFANRCKEYEKIHGPRFQLPRLLANKVKAGAERFD